MSLAEFSDPMVFALAVVGAPQLQNLRHSGHSDLLVTWMRIIDEQVEVPRWQQMVERIHSSYRASLALIDPQEAPHRWRWIGTDAAMLLRRHVDLEEVMGEHNPLAQFLKADAMDLPDYYELDCNSATLGILHLPVFLPETDKLALAVGIFLLSPIKNDIDLTEKFLREWRRRKRQ